MSGGTWPVNSYWIPRNFIIKNPYVVFENAAKRLIAFLKTNQRFNCGSIFDVILNSADAVFKVADATKTWLPKNSLDYVIIDPPHTDEAQFFELSLFYTSWLKKELRFKDELIINPKQGKTLEVYMKMLRETAKRIYWALKPGKCFTIILHEEDQSILRKCVETISGVGFKLINNDQENNYNIYTFQKENN
jgi:hypothetical protein